MLLSSKYEKQLTVEIFQQLRYLFSEVLASQLIAHELQLRGAHLRVIYKGYPSFALI